MRSLLIFGVVGSLLGCNPTPKECSDSSLITAYRDEDRDGHGDAATQELVCPREDGGPPAGYVTTSGDCDDRTKLISPTGIEDCDGLDNNCDGVIDENLRQLNFYFDADLDTFGDPATVTQACSPPEGYVENNWDCDDTDTLTFPQGVEFCDDKDNDCDGLIDDQDPSIDPDSQPVWYADVDGDGFGDIDRSMQQCEPPPTAVSNGDDCDDSTSARNPDATEICNGVDDDCDGHIDDSDSNLDTSGQNVFYYDADDDGFGDPDETIVACFAPWFYVTNDEDCDDAEPLLGNDLTGFWVVDGDGDGFGTGLAEGPFCDPPDATYVLQAKGPDCDDAEPTVNPDADEVCDTLDNDCDGAIDDADGSLDLTTQTLYYADADGDTYGNPASAIARCDAPPATSTDNTDCHDGNPDINPGATEICNGDVDDDCNGLADEGDLNLDPASELTWYFDFDNDGYGDLLLAIGACSRPLGYVGNPDDCDDNDPQILGNIPWVDDLDGDGFGAGPILGPSCSAPTVDAVPVSNGTDCDDTDTAFYPGALEVCGDGLDQDCDLADLDCFPNTCAETVGYPTLATGTHVFSDDLSGNTDDISFGAGNACTGAPTDGADALVPVTLLPGEALYVDYRNDGDASAYLLADCTAPADTDCATGADNNLAIPAGGEESLWYLNISGATENLFLALDCNGACTGWDLDITIETPDKYVPANCNEANAFAPWFTGGYAVAGTVAGLAGNINFTNGNACTGFSSTGQDAILPVELADGETVDVSYTQLAGDASVYLVEVCSDALNTCLNGQDQSLDGEAELLTYTNSSGGLQEVRLVLDCFDSQGCGAFDLRMSIY